MYKKVNIKSLLLAGLALLLLWYDRMLFIYVSIIGILIFFLRNYIKKLKDSWLVIYILFNFIITPLKSSNAFIEDILNITMLFAVGLLLARFIKRQIPKLKKVKEVEPRL